MPPTICPRPWISMRGLLLAGGRARAGSRRIIRDRPVLPALVDELEAVAVRIPDLGSVVARIVVKLRSGWMDLGRTGSQCGSMGGVYHLFGVRHEADMRGARRGCPMLQPEEYSPIGAKALEVWMTCRAILAVIIQPADDPEDRKHLLVKGDRTIGIIHRQKDVIEHEALPIQMI